MKSLEYLTIPEDIEVLEHQTKQTEYLLQFHQIFFYLWEVSAVFRKTICLVKEFFLVNFFIGVSEECYNKFRNNYLIKHHLF